MFAARAALSRLCMAVSSILSITTVCIRELFGGASHDTLSVDLHEDWLSPY
jgi:hypothetical protein